MTFLNIFIIFLASILIVKEVDCEVRLKKIVPCSYSGEFARTINLTSESI